MLAAAVDEVAIDVRSGRRSGESEPSRHHRHWHSSRQHRGGHEVPQIMEPNTVETRPDVPPGPALRYMLVKSAPSNHEAYREA